MDTKWIQKVKICEKWKLQKHPSENFQSWLGPDRSCLFPLPCIWWRLHFPSFPFFPFFSFFVHFASVFSFSSFSFCFLNSHHFQLNFAWNKSREEIMESSGWEWTKQLHLNILTAGGITTHLELQKRCLKSWLTPPTACTYIHILQYSLKMKIATQDELMSGRHMGLSVRGALKWTTEEAQRH